MTDTPQQSTSWSSLLTGIAVGVFAGAAVSLLLAPKSGKETREDVTTRLTLLKDRVDQLTQDVTDTAKVRLAELQADLAQAVETGRSAAEEQAAKLRQQVGLE